MAGTDNRGASHIDPHAPSIVLVGPQLGENIGACARAMLNCGLGDLRLVAPRDGWPSPQAEASASGARAVLDAARCFDDMAAAVADQQHVYVTTARPRDMDKRVVDPYVAAAEIHAAASRGERSCVVFGRERTGLFNDEVVLAGTVITMPLNPGFASLNLAQAVLLIAYAWRTSSKDPVDERTLPAGRAPATHGEIVGLFEHLEGALDLTGFFKTDALRPVMVRNLRNLFQRAALSDQEVRSLHGVVTALSGLRKHQVPTPASVDDPEL